MTQTKQEVQPEEAVTPQQNVDPLSELFEERDRPKEPKPEAKENVSGDSKSEGVKDVKSKETSEKKEDIKEEDEDEDIPSSEIDKTKTELEKTQKRLSENQKYAHKQVQKVKNALKIAQTLVDNGDLIEDDARSLIEALQSEEDETQEYYKGESHPFAPIFKIANKELENIRKYTDDETLQDKVSAFDYFLSVSSQEEIEEVRDELIKLIDDPIKLTKKMLSIGQKAYEESYKEIKEAGGFKHYLSKKSQEIENMQKKIDKLEKKLSKYETYDKPTFRIDEMADVDSKESESDDPLTPMFKARDIIRR